jgi:hypothetical protein
MTAHAHARELTAHPRADGALPNDHGLEVGSVAHKHGISTVFNEPFVPEGKGVPAARLEPRRRPARERAAAATARRRSPVRVAARS